MRTKLIWCTIWLLTGALVIASVDGTPDPPAIDPHTSVAKALCLPDGASSFHTQPGYHETAVIHTQVRLQRTIFEKENEPDGPGDFITQTGQASDTSPPVCAARLRS
jgi:hypothetical protein